MVILIGIGSAFLLAIVNVYLKRLFNNIHTNELAPLSFFLSAITLILFSPLYFQLEYSNMALAIMLLLFILDALANYFYYKAIELGEVSYESIYMSLSPIFTLFLSSFAISIVPFNTAVSVAGIIISIYILNLKYDTGLMEPFRNIFKNNNYLGLVYAILAGTTAVLSKLLFNMEAVNPPTLYMLRAVAIFILLTITLKPRVSLIDRKLIYSAWLRVLFIIASFLMYLYAISLGNVVVASTVSSVYPAFVLIFSYFMFKEKFTWQKGSAIVSIVFFITLLNLS